MAGSGTTARLSRNRGTAGSAPDSRREPTILVVEDEREWPISMRRGPDLTGDEVLNRIRAAGHDCWVIMVTAVDPGLDIVELDVDDYVTKPATRAQLTRIIENLRVQSRYSGDGRRELTALSNKMETLEDEHAPDQLAGTDAYQQLEADLKDLSETLVEDGDR